MCRPQVILLHKIKAKLICGSFTKTIDGGRLKLTKLTRYFGTIIPIWLGFEQIINMFFKPQIAVSSYLWFMYPITYTNRQGEGRLITLELVTEHNDGMVVKFTGSNIGS